MTPLRHLFNRDQQPALTTEIHLQNDLVVVHPTPPSTEEDASLAVPQQIDNETLLSGCVVVVSDSDILLWNIRIALVIFCKYRRPGEDVWQQGIIYEQGRVFTHLDSEARISTSSDRRTIHRQIDFAMMVPSNIPTHEYVQHAIILSQIRVSVEYSRNTRSDAALRALPSTPPVYVDEHPGRTVAGRQMRTQSHTGADVKWPPAANRIRPHLTATADPTDIAITYGSSSLGAPKHPVQTFIKNFAIIANGNAAVGDGGAGSARMKSHKRGVSQGVGEWDLYWWSDVFSVGGYVSPRIEFKHMSPQCTIFGIHVCLLQTYTVTPIDVFRADHSQSTVTPKHQYPTETFVLYKDGAVPSVKQPKTNGSALFSARARFRSGGYPPKQNGGDEHGNDGISFTWQPGRIRINDDHSMRPSVFPGTNTPLNITHELSLRVFFSVKGETMDGSSIRDGKGVDEEGEMRMLVINVGERVSSVCLRMFRAVRPQNGHNYQDVRTSHLLLPLVYP
ncbi:hypothetical protein QFC21_005577 [Naganishia friedmannii]|uniref:Uncharacterized protein n=1 Tax=Naganishia friedmannii TaxID=89922 RepID=A0ACC2V9A7_9TREE|nr:hypothetical protein QFC21_005577 [Naganishia friedmannii]